MTVSTQRVNYFEEAPTEGITGVEVVLSCKRCGHEGLELVNQSRIIAEAEGSVILRCPRCLWPWQLRVMLSVCPRDNRQRKAPERVEEYA